MTKIISKSVKNVYIPTFARIQLLVYIKIKLHSPTQDLYNNNVKKNNFL